jgi:hypothetical protein
MASEITETVVELSPTNIWRRWPGSIVCVDMQNILGVEER